MMLHLRQIPKAIKLILEELWSKSSHNDIILLVGILGDLGFDVRDHVEALDYMGQEIPTKEKCIAEILKYHTIEQEVFNLVQDNLEFSKFSKGRARRSLRAIFAEASGKW